MTRAEAYAEGWHEGRRWAERDLGEGLGLQYDMEQALTDDARRAAEIRHTDSEFPNYGAHLLGRARGYRDTVARFKTGTLTPEMFENARVNR